MDVAFGMDGSPPPLAGLRACRPSNRQPQVPQDRFVIHESAWGSKTGGQRLPQALLWGLRL